MNIDLFSVTIFIGNIDASKIKLINKKTKPTFGSDVLTSFEEGKGSTPTKESLDYLYPTIVGLLDQKIKTPYKIQLINIWENHYINSDFQEKHIHPRSDLSFIIYKKIDESKTVFVNPSDKLLEAFYPSYIKQNLFGPCQYTPECRENQIIIFPSFLEHYVKKTNNAITIAGNLSLTFQQ